MPAKTPKDIMDRAVALYRAGRSSTKAGEAVGVSASVVAREVRRLGLTRHMSEAKKLDYKMNPRPIQVIDKARIYKSGDQNTKVCTTCDKELPATTACFYKRKRSNGRTYLGSSCKECVIAERRKHRAENPEKVRDSLRRSREKNGHKHDYQKAVTFLFSHEAKEKRKKTNKMWQEKNQTHVAVYRKAYNQECKEKIKERDRRWRENNQEKARANRLNRKARVKQAKGKISQSDIHQKITAQNSTCYWCGEPLKSFHVDHFVPIARGGTNTPDNIVISCPTCNVSRGAKTEEEYLRYVSLLTDSKEEIEKRRKYFREAMQRHRDKKKRTPDPR